MSSEDMARELERLRADVAALKEARRESGVPPPDTPQEGQAPAAFSSSSGVAEELSETVQSQLEELGELIHDEVKNLPAVTGLTIFTLGILLGRFLR